jgi:hypothetical protein
MVSPVLDDISSLRPSPRTSQHPESSSRPSCIFCGKPVTFLSRIRGERWFCSPAHRKVYQRGIERLAMESLGWNRSAGAQVQAIVQPSQIGKRHSTLAGLARLALLPTAAAPIKSRPIPPTFLRASGFCNLPYTPRFTPANLEATVPLLGLPVRATNVAVTARGVTSPLACGPQAIVLPQRAAKYRDCNFLPAAAPQVVATVEIIRPRIQPRLRNRQPVARPESYVHVIPPMGVYDPDETASGRPQPPAISAVIGERILGEPEAAVHTASQRTLRLRRFANRRDGVFIPGLNMGTLRQRMAFGPAANGRRTSPFVDARVQGRQHAHSA